MTWSESGSRGVHADRLQAEEDRRAGIHRYQPSGGRLHGERGKLEDRVFPLSYSSYYLMELKRWAVRAGITKDITFHSGRHTFAVMMLDLRGGHLHGFRSFSDTRKSARPGSTRK